MRRLACRGMEIKRTLYIVSQCSPECSLGRTEPQRFIAAQSRMQAGPPPRPSQIKIVCLPAYNLYTTQPVAMLPRGTCMVSEGPRPTRKRFFDTQPSSDEENQDDEMPELGGDSDTEFEEEQQRQAADPVASTKDDIQADDDADSSLGKQLKAPNMKRVFVLQKRGIWRSTTPPMFMLLFASNCKNSVKSILLSGGWFPFSLLFRFDGNNLILGKKNTPKIHACIIFQPSWHPKCAMRLYIVQHQIQSKFISLLFRMVHYYLISGIFRLDFVCHLFCLTLLHHCSLIVSCRPFLFSCDDKSTTKRTTKNTTHKCIN